MGVLAVEGEEACRQRAKPSPPRRGLQFPRGTSSSRHSCRLPSSASIARESGVLMQIIDRHLSERDGLSKELG